MKHLLFMLTTFCCGCSTGYYVCTANEPTDVYMLQHENSKSITIPAGKQFIMKGRGTGYRAIRFANRSGFIKSSHFRRETHYSEPQANRLVFTPDSTYILVDETSVVQGGG